MVAGIYVLWFGAARQRTVRQAAWCIIAGLALGALAGRMVWRPLPGAETVMVNCVWAVGVPALVIGAAVVGRRRGQRRHRP